MFQNLTEPLMANTTYTLSAWFGNRYDRGERSGPTGYNMRFMAGQSIIASVIGTLPDGWKYDETTVTIADDHPAIGEPLKIEIWRRTGSAQINFDVVSLTAAPIPEPASTTLLLICGVFSLAVFVTRKRRNS